MFETVFHTKLFGPANATSARNGYLSTNLDDLNFAFAAHKVYIEARVQPKGFTSPDFSSDSYRSTRAFISFRTAGRIPDHPPRTDIGSFCVFENGTVLLYAESVADAVRNGDYFKYMFIEVGSPLFSIRYIWANVIAFMLDASSTYTNNNFSVSCKNTEGWSRERSYIVVPGLNNRCPRPIGLKLIKTPEDVYYLSWRQPPKELLTKSCPEISSYTVFRQTDHDYLPDEVVISFERVSNETFRYNFTSRKLHDFAVSGNSANSSSGMIWAERVDCPFSPKEKLLNAIQQRSFATRIALEWTLNCLEEHLVSGYAVRYCPMTSWDAVSCAGESIRINVTHEPTFGYNITDLTPLTWYMVQIQLVTPLLREQFSDPYVIQTREDMPSPPRSLSFSDVTNSSVRLSWQRPDHLNGVLTDYELSFNGKTMKIRANNDTRVGHLLTGLKSAQKYEVRVKACTSVGCSPDSNAIRFHTRTGTPGEILHLNKVEIGQQKIVTWEPPAGSATDYYEIREQMMSDDGQQIERTAEINGTSCTLVNPECRANLVSLSVRGVNIARSPFAHATAGDVELARNAGEICTEQDNHLRQLHINSTLLPGHWSSPLQLYCVVESSLVYYVTVIPLIVVIIVVSIAYATMLVRRKLRRMADIWVELPPGLEDIRLDMIKMSFLVDKNKKDANF